MAQDIPLSALVSVADWHGEQACLHWYWYGREKNNYRIEMHLAAFLRHTRIHDAYRRRAFLLSRKRPMKKAA
jgi:hypothetical protein